MQHKFLFILFLIIPFAPVNSQEIRETNTDSIYFKALELYKNQKFQISLSYTERGLDLAPEYHDIRILRVRNLWALNIFDRAGNDIEYLLKKARDYPNIRGLAERHVGYIDNPDNALNFIHELENSYGISVNLQVLKSSLLLKAGRLEESRQLALNLFQNSGIDDDQRYRLQNILNRTIKNEIGINYQYVNFSENYNRENPWQIVSGEYLHFFRRTAILGRVNYTNRSNDEGYLYEIESYPVFSDKVYGFLNAGISNSKVYPDFRFSASVFVNIFKFMEVEAGGRLLNFTEQDYFTGVLGLTAYTGKYYFNLRSFIGPERLGTLVQNYQFNIRYYFRNIDNYIFGRLGSGISPDETGIFSQVQDDPFLQAYYLNLGLNKTIGPHHIFQFSVGGLLEDLNQEKTGKQIIASFGYRYRF